VNFNDILKLELAEHIEARKMVMKRAFESVRNGMGCFFSGASRCVSKFDDAFGELPVEGKALSVEAVGRVEDAFFEENLLVSIAVAMAEEGMESKENIRLSTGSAASDGVGIDVSKKKWAEMRGDFVNGGSNLSKSLRRNKKKGNEKKHPAQKQRGESPRKASAFRNLFTDESHANGFFKVFNFFGNKGGSSDGNNPDLSAISSIDGGVLSSPSSLGSGGNRSAGDVEAEEELKKRIHALTTGENLDNSSTPSGYITQGALTKRLSESSLLSEISYFSSDAETDNLLRRGVSNAPNGSKNSSMLAVESVLGSGTRRGSCVSGSSSYEDTLVSGQPDLVLRAAVPFLDVVDLTNCRGVNKIFNEALGGDLSIWRRCVRRGGVVEGKRGDFWIWIMYGSGLRLGTGEGSRGGGEYRKLKAGRKYWALLKEAAGTFETLNEQRGAGSSSGVQGSPVKRGGLGGGGGGGGGFP